MLEGHGAEIDTTPANSRLIFGIFTPLAEFERELISERTKAGMAAAQRNGKNDGRPRKLTDEQIALACSAIKKDNDTRTAVAARLGVDVATLRRALRAMRPSTYKT